MLGTRIPNSTLVHNLLAIGIGISAEILQNLIMGISSITELINKIYETGDLPIDFINCVFIPIPKVSKAMECNEHRTISLISRAAKFRLKIIKKRIKPIM